MTAHTTVIIIKILCIILFLSMFSGCMMKHTDSTEVGVLMVTWNPLEKLNMDFLGSFGRQGVLNKVYSEGETHFFIPFIHEFYTFSSTLQNLEMTVQIDAGDIKGRDDLLFKTIDGNDIGFDVIIQYQIIKDKAPDILQGVANNSEELRAKIVRTVTRSKPRDIFGELTTEEFYVSENRAKKALKAKKILNEILGPYGVYVESVNTKDYRFNPLYQKAIEDKKIADQMAAKNKAATRASEEEYKKKIEEAIGDVNQMKASIDGEFLMGKLDADAYYTSKVEISKAIETEGEAEAEGIRQMADALTGPGGEIMVKMEVAEALKGKNILLLPLSGGGMDLKTTNINRLLETFGVQKAASPEKSTSETDIVPGSSIVPAVEKKNNDQNPMVGSDQDQGPDSGERTSQLP